MILETNSGKYEVTSHSEIGPRSEQQDQYLVLNTSGYLLLAVADGMGGEPNGRHAAETAIKELQEFANTIYKQITKEPEQLRFTFPWKTSKYKLGCTTLCVVFLIQDKLHVFNLGDSSLRVHNSSGLLFKTTRHGIGNYVSKYVPEDTYPDYFTYPLTSDATVFLYTDGCDSIFGNFQERYLTQSASEIIKQSPFTLYDNTTLITLRKVS